MNIEQHIAHRAWAFEALDTLESFLSDPDFAGDIDEEGRIIGRKRRELKDGKYRVVILGEFNVGKSALVNAFLGDEYLPMVLEECTTKITHIVKSDDMKAILNLSSPLSDAELETLGRLVAAFGVHADVLASEDMSQVVVAFPDNQPGDLLRTLRPLVTVMADEEFPQLRTLRGKFDEIYIHLPTDLLADDVALVDSPGVHSISETNTKIAEEIIPNSHLVICLLDSQNPGTEHNREFIEKVVKHRHRKVLFVINKADQLNADEIDPKGRRGPAKDLHRSLQGVVEGPEVFFISALYALTAAQLARGIITLDDLDGNNKIKIPWSMQRELMQSETPEAAIAAHLADQSNVTVLRDRLLRYLYTENREGAILESVCRFVDDKAWGFARPIEVQLDMAKNVPRLVELTGQRETLAAEMEDSARRAETTTAALRAMCGGGSVGDREYQGYEALLFERITPETVQHHVLDPAKAWLGDTHNFRAARQGGFAPLAEHVENLANTFVQEVCDALNAEIGAVEGAALDAMAPLRPSTPALPESISAPRIRIEDLRAGLAASYVAHALVGAILCAAGGAAVVMSGVLGDLPNADQVIQLGAVAGGAAGMLAGLLLRAATAKPVLRRKVLAAAGNQVLRALLGAGKNSAASVRDQLRTAVAERSAAFSGGVEAAFDAASREMEERFAAIREEEEELRRQQEEVIARLEPKLAHLAELGRKALETAEANAPGRAETES